MVCFILIFLCIPQIGFAFKGINIEGISGKADFHYKHTESMNEYNMIGWSPYFKGGWGIIDLDSGGAKEYSGGYFHPFLSKDGKGELILGFLEVDTPASYAYEIQGEYRFPFGLGLGGGSVSRREGGSDVEFGKLSFRNQWNNWQYIFETQFQSVGGEDSAGGYIAFYNDQLMVTYGNDGEQWRTALGCIAPETKSLLRPAMEVLYVDNTIGVFDGNEFLFVNGTLKFQGGFLSHSARLGRAMGPTGLEYGNPLGFLGPTWNRRLDVWELGGLMDFRIDRVKNAVGVVTERYESMVYPFQFDRYKNPLDYVYLGGFHSKVSGEKSSGIIGGFFGKTGFLKLGAGVDYNFDNDEKRIFVGIIDKF